MYVLDDVLDDVLHAYSTPSPFLSLTLVMYMYIHPVHPLSRDPSIEQRKLLQCTPDVGRLKTSGGGCCTSADCAKYPLVKLQSNEYWSCEASANKNLGNRCYARQKAKKNKKKCGVDKSLGCGPTADDFALCENGIKDADESDIDCGGKACAKCEAGQRCKKRDDCAAKMDCKGGFCDAKKCSSDKMCYFSKKCLSKKSNSPNTLISACVPSHHALTGTFHNFEVILDFLFFFFINLPTSQLSLPGLKMGTKEGLIVEPLIAKGAKMVLLANSIFTVNPRFARKANAKLQVS
jgi:hypothetical protein